MDGRPTGDTLLCVATWTREKKKTLIKMKWISGPAIVALSMAISNANRA